MDQVLIIQRGIRHGGKTGGSHLIGLGHGKFYMKGRAAGPGQIPDKLRPGKFQGPAALAKYDVHKSSFQ